MSKLKHSARRISTLPFVATWTVLTIVAWLLTLIPVYAVGFDTPLPESSLYVWLGAVPALTMAMMQQQIIQRTYGLLLKHWIRLSLLGGAIGGGVMFIMERFWDIYAIPAQTTTVIVAPMLLQYLILRKHVKGAWLWLLSGVASGVAFAIPFTSDVVDYYLLTVAFAAIFHGAVTALSARWLFRMTQQQTQPKQKTDIAQLDLTHRRDNLRLSESNLPYEEIMDYSNDDARLVQQQEQSS